MFMATITTYNFDASALSSINTSNINVEFSSTQWTIDIDEQVHILYRGVELEYASDGSLNGEIDYFEFYLNGQPVVIIEDLNFSFSDFYSLDLTALLTQYPDPQDFIAALESRISINFETETETEVEVELDDVFENIIGSDDIYDGGAGTDTFVYTTSFSDHTVTILDGTITITSEIDGTDSLTNVERIEFSDYIVNATVQESAASISSDVLQKIQELYVAFFNRVPDADGLEYWIEQYKAGQSIEHISEQFYQAGIEYSETTGFSADMSNLDFINVVYRNVLGREEGADDDGLAFWNNALETGAATNASLVAEILDAAHNYLGDAEWGWVADLLDNKVDVANTFAVVNGLNYLTAEESIIGGMQIAAAVTDSDINTALELIGIAS
jgi:hypothetical protein